ncbi:MAG: sigma factor-like helix-turn-helix DNA-binding protein [Acidimicrobiales bacterium]
MAEHGQPVRVPVHVMDAAWRVRRTQARREAERGCSPTVSEVASELQLAPKQVADLLACLHEPRSLSERGGNEGAELAESVVDPLARSAHDQVVRALLPSAVTRLLAGLDDREADVIRLHYGLGGARPRTLAEIGACYQLTRERVRQIEARALDKLHNPTSREATVALGLVTS